MTSPAIFEVVRRFAVGELITLYDIDLSNIGGGIFHFTNNIFEESIPIIFDGVTYAYMPVAVESIDVDSNSAPPQPRFLVATSGGPVNSLIRTYKDLRGAKVTRKRTFAEFLDERPDGTGGTEVNPGADSSALLPTDFFIVDRKVAANKTMAEFQLCAPTDQEGIQLPLGIVTKRFCTKVYRFNNGDGTFTYTGRYDPCPWTGVTYFNSDDASTTAVNDKCSKTMNGCTVRFGKTVALPYGGYPGVKAPNEAG